MIATIIIVVGGGALSLVAFYVSITSSQRLVYGLALAVFGKLQRLSLTYHSQHPLGDDLLQRVSQDVFFNLNAVFQVALPATVSLLFLTGMSVILASVDLTLPLVSLAVVPLLAVSIALFTKPMDTTTTRMYASHGAFTALAEQGLSAIKVVQRFVHEAYVQRKLEGRARDLSDAYQINFKVSDGYKEATSAITGVAAALLLGLGRARVLAGHLSLAIC